MELLEYQVKALFRQVGIPVLPSQTINNPQQIKQLTLPYPIVLKSQVYAQEHEQVSGIRFADNRIDAIAAARTIFNLPIWGSYPEIILAETCYSREQQLFLALHLDYSLQRPVLLGAIQENDDGAVAYNHLHKVVIDQEFSPFYARHLSVKMGLARNLICPVSNIMAKMYHLLQDKDLDIIAINPLVVSNDGEIMALDGEIVVNDYALGRHPELLNTDALERNGSSLNHASCVNPAFPHNLYALQQEGKIGILANSTGLALETWDLLQQEKGKPSCCLVIGEDNCTNLLATSTLLKQLQAALDQLLNLSPLKVILINILASPAAAATFVQAITEYLQGKLENSGLDNQLFVNHLPQFVIRLAGGDGDLVNQNSETIPVHWTDNLKEAVQRTVLLTRA